MASSMRQKRIEAVRRRHGGKPVGAGNGAGAQLGQVYGDRLRLWDKIVELREQLGVSNPHLLIGDDRDSALMLLRDDAERHGRDADSATLEWITSDPQTRALVGKWPDGFTLRAFVKVGKTFRRPKPRYRL